MLNSLFAECVRSVLSLFLLPQERTFPKSMHLPHIGSCLLSICGSDTDVMVVPSVSVGLLLCGFSVVDKDILHLLPRLHLTVFLMEEKY